MPTKIVVNCATGQSEEVELTAEEIAQLETERAESLARQEAEDAAKAQKEADRKNAMAKLSALGLNENEVKAIIGA